jgi:hypothetical protein
MNKILATLALVALSSTLLVACASSAQKASAGGYKEVSTPVDEYLKTKAEMEEDNIVAAVGTGESSDEQIARRISEDEARTAMASSISTIVQRMSEQYAQNVGTEAKKLWEEGARNLTNQELNGATVNGQRAFFNEETGKWKSYTLMVLKPELVKKALEASLAGQEELELRVKKDDMMAKMDAATQAYETKYKKK